MRVILDHPNPFLLSHGGFQIQIEQTYNALRHIGVAAEYLRWWDGEQPADIIHFFGLPSPPYIYLAKKKGLRVVLSQLLTGLGSRSPRVLPFQKAVITAARKTLPNVITSRFSWEVFEKVDASIALTDWEAHLMRYMFGAPNEKVHVVANGVEEVFLQNEPAQRGQWLICTATIAERKRVLELAQAAVIAKTPVWIIGKPYADSEPYAQRFLEFARQNAGIIRYEGAISDRAQLARVYREARGFALLSTMESLSLSALESAACGCPLFLSDLPWARTTFKESASYCPIASSSQTAPHLRRFYDAAPTLKVPPKPPTWIDIAGQLKKVYELVLDRP
ncbi:MAG TPA: glycosyltransferase family 4 protein [Verrucomicrobiae bacterium]|jgi:glycosyltransferase involved in cell wall biosynthesis|nr:glycosyltransferase family 4 protein [Verrucomicrobiae bacterium]